MFSARKHIVSALRAPARPEHLLSTIKTTVRDSAGPATLFASRSVEFSIPEDGEFLLTLFDSRGRSAGNAFDGYMAAGIYRTDLQSVALQRKTRAAGLYIVSLFRTDNGKKELVATCTAALAGKVTD